MAAGDYHTCDNCGERKTFYDANMDPEWIDGAWRYDYCKSSIEGVPPFRGYRIYALCTDCEKTHEIVIMTRTAALSDLIAGDADLIVPDTLADSDGDDGA